MHNIKFTLKSYAQIGMDLGVSKQYIYKIANLYNLRRRSQTPLSIRLTKRRNGKMEERHTKDNYLGTTTLPLCGIGVSHPSASIVSASQLRMCHALLTGKFVSMTKSQYTKEIKKILDLIFR